MLQQPLLIQCLGNGNFLGKLLTQLVGGGGGGGWVIHPSGLTKISAVYYKSRVPETF